MRESHIHTAIKKKFTQNTELIPYPFACEVKISKGISVPFNAVQPHQIDGLLEAQKGQIVKLLDTMGSRFTLKKPYDLIWLRGVQSFVCVVFYVPRKKKLAYFVPVHKWMMVQKNHPRKSIRETELAPLAEYIISLNKR